MAKWSVGSVLGAKVAHAVKRGELWLGIVGWMGSCFFIAAATWLAGHPESSPAKSPLDMYANSVPWLVMLAISVRRRGPSRWLAQWGFAFGYRFALFFGFAALFVWIFDRNARSAALFGGVLIFCVEISTALAALAAWLHWDQVEPAVRKFRRYLNGGSTDSQEKSK